MSFHVEMKKAKNEKCRADDVEDTPSFVPIVVWPGASSPVPFRSNGSPPGVPKAIRFAMAPEVAVRGLVDARLNRRRQGKLGKP
jgi:hypothetical protein